MKIDVLKLGEPTANGRIYDPETTTLSDDSGFIYAYSGNDDFQDLTKVIGAYSLASIEDGMITAFIQHLPTTPMGQKVNFNDLEFSSQGFGELDSETGIVYNFKLTSIGAAPKTES